MIVSRQPIVGKMLALAHEFLRDDGYLFLAVRNMAFF